MASFSDNLKMTLLKTVEAFGKGASTLAEGAQQKLNEIHLEARRHEILEAIPGCVQELYAQGVELPEALTNLLAELGELDEKLAQLRPSRTPEATAEEPADEPPAETTDTESSCPCGECTCEAPADDSLLPDDLSSPADEVSSEPAVSEQTDENT